MEEGAQPKLEGDAGGEAEQAHQSDADADGADDERDIEASPSGSASGFGGKGTSTPERPPSISSTRVTPASKEAAKKAKYVPCMLSLARSKSCTTAYICLKP